VSETAAAPARGLPGRLPVGETLLWQGSPVWRVLARRAFHTRKVAVYCGLLLAWRVVSGLADGESAATIGLALLSILPLAGAAVGILAFMGWLYARMTVYSITNRRLVIRSGVALPVTMNIPFRTISGAALSEHPHGTGDISVALTDENRIAYLMLWPNARPWWVKHAQPMLRAVPDAKRVATILADALAAGTDAALAPGSSDVPPRSFVTAAAA
jgi:hypothetical protein